MRILHGITALIGGIAISIGTALILSGCSPAARALESRPSDPPRIAAPTANSAYGDPSLTKTDVKLEIKVKSKQCFGSAGCSIEYAIDARTSIAKIKRSNADWSVTYEITGDSSGPITGTLTLHPDGTYQQESFMQADTKRSAVQLKIKVLEVERA